MHLIIPVGLIFMLVICWFWQFIQLMILSDSDFPGKNDKILWFLIFIIFPFIGPGAFIWWKKAYLYERNS